MELDSRKQKILAAVIESYVGTGEPVGSKALQSTDGLSVSSATIRNELAALTMSGYLRQPHTSAGRVPTTEGYRYYVDRLAEPKPPGERMKSYIYGTLSSSSDAPEHILNSAAQLLSELGNTPALASTPPGSDARVHRFKFVRTGRRTSMAVLITSTGLVRSRLFRCDFDVTPELLNVYDRALNEATAGMPLTGLNRAFAQTFAAGFGELGLLMPDMLMAVMDACKEAAGLNVYTGGVVRLLYQDEISPRNTRALLEALNSGSEREKLLRDIPEGTQVSIGKENPLPYLSQSAVFTSRYTIDGRPAGALAVISPLRTDYPAMLGILDCTAETVGELIDEIVSAV